MTEVKLVLMNTVVRHQQPAAAALLHGMQRHAAGGLHHQHQQALRVAMDAIDETHRFAAART